MEEVMTFEPGEVVTLKSGGQPMTVVSADEEHIDCVWIGEQGQLFRESIPAAALIAVAADDDDAEDEADEDDDEVDESDDDTPKRKRKVA